MMKIEEGFQYQDDKEKELMIRYLSRYSSKKLKKVLNKKHSKQVGASLFKNLEDDLSEDASVLYKRIKKDIVNYLETKKGTENKLIKKLRKRYGEDIGNSIFAEYEEDTINPLLLSESSNFYRTEKSA